MIVLVAAFLRFHNWLDIEHNVDHAYPVWQALMTLEHGVLPLVGQGTSVLFANPPLTGYLALPFVALTRSPLGAYLLIISLNTLGVFLAFRAARTLLGTRPALVAAGLLAVNPWVIEYSRTTWVQSLLPFFACALAWLLWPVLLGSSKRPVRRTILALVILTLYTHTYLLAFMALAPVAVLVFTFRRNLPRKGLLTGAVIFVLGVSLYGTGLLGQVDTVAARLNEFSGSPPRLSAEAWSHAVRLITGEDYELARGQNAPIQDAMLRHALSRVAHFIIYSALLLGLVLSMLSLLRPALIRNLPLPTGTGNINQSMILLSWFLLPILFMSYVGQPVHPFYQLIGLPAGHILAALGLCTAFRVYTRWGSRLLLLLGLLFAAVMAANSIRFAQETAVTPAIDHLSALPLEAGLRLGRAINDHLPPGGIVFADTDEWILNSFAGKTFPVSRDTRAPSVQIIPPAGALYIQLGFDTPQIVPYATRAETFVLRDGSTLTLDRYTPNTLPPVDHPSYLSSEQGIAFLGYDMEQDTQTVTLTTFWRVENPAPGVEASFYAPFVHIFDASGARVHIVDGQVVSGDQWRAGDLHVHCSSFELPDTGAPFSLHVGQYDSIHGQNVIFLPDFTPTIVLDTLAS